MYHNKEFLIELTKEFPKEVDLDRLIHVTYNVENEEVKLYHASDDLSYLVKTTKDEQDNQYSPTQDKNMLENYKQMAKDFLGYEPNFKQIIIDAVMDDVIYFYTGNATQEEFTKFYKILLEKFDIKEKEFFKVLSFLNNKNITSFEEAFKCKTIPVSKVPLKSGYFKVYVRPFYYGNSFVFNENTTRFLESLLSSKPLKNELLKNMIVIYEFHTGRTQVCTEDKFLKAKISGQVNGHKKFKFKKEK